MFLLQDTERCWRSLPTSFWALSTFCHTQWRAICKCSKMLTPLSCLLHFCFYFLSFATWKDILIYNNNYITVIFICTSFHLFSFLSHAPPSSGVSLAWRNSSYIDLSCSEWQPQAPCNSKQWTHWVHFEISCQCEMCARFQRFSGKGVVNYLH